MPQRRWAWLSKILIRQGHEVTVVAPPAHYLREVNLVDWAKSVVARRFTVEQGASGERILRCWYFPSGRSLTKRIINQATVAMSMLFFRARLSKELKGYRPDLVIGTVPALPTSVVTYLVARTYGAPFVIDLRDAWPELLRENEDWNSAVGSPSIRERLARLGPMQVLAAVTERLMNFSLQRADGIITTSERLTNVLKKRGRPNQVVETIRNVFPPKTQFKATYSQRRENSLNVLYAGTLGRAQKLENALRAAKLAQNAGCDIRLRLVGDGAAWEALHEEAARLGVSVEICHRQPAEELEDHYAWADTALVHLTDWEPLTRAVPSKTYELMSLGIHICGVVDGETADLIRRFGAGDVVPPESPQALADLWLELSRDRGRLKRTGKGAAWVEKERDDVVPATLIAIVNQFGG